MILNMNPFMDESAENFKGIRRNESKFKKLERLIMLAEKMESQQDSVGIFEAKHEVTCEQNNRNGIVDLYLDDPVLLMTDDLRADFANMVLNADHVMMEFDNDEQAIKVSFVVDGIWLG